MDPYLLMAIEVVITAVLSVEVYKLHCLSKGGALASLVIGVLLAYYGSVSAFFIMSFFVIMSFFATMRDIDKKIAMGLQEGQFGERGWKNVVAVGFPPVLFTVIHYYYPIDETLYVIAFLTSVVVAGADTVASEIGVKDPKAYMITTLKPVTPGTNGGVSKLGMVSSTVMAIVTAALGWLVMTASLSWLMLIPFTLGVFGNLLDSLFGAWLENRGWISKFTVNWSTELISAILAAALWFYILA
ncbi:DUF92 domain-containing protein [Methanomassiliicoccales archaeon LGM-RCC1]|nr:DUF92 domain-containing protein [Methanomassiliicoccales archaeon LGM-RCC1]